MTICFMFVLQSFWHCGPHQQGATPHISDLNVYECKTNCTYCIHTQLKLLQAFGGPDVTSLSNYFLLARAGQVLAHCVSVGPLAINVRFTFFLAQLLLLAQIIWKTYTALHAHL